MQWTFLGFLSTFDKDQLGNICHHWEEEFLINNQIAKFESDLLKNYQDTCCII